MTLPPEKIEVLAREVGLMIDDLVRHAGVSFALTLCNDDPEGSYASWFSNTNPDDALFMARKMVENMEERMERMKNEPGKN